MSAEARRLGDLREGESGRIERLESPESPEGARLAAFGLVPGARVRVQQRFPAVVVEVEESLVAIEASLARGVYVLT